MELLTITSQLAFLQVIKTNFTGAAVNVRCEALNTLLFCGKNTVRIFLSAEIIYISLFTAKKFSVVSGSKWPPSRNYDRTVTHTMAGVMAQHCPSEGRESFQ